jgi:hypothetical protein
MTTPRKKPSNLGEISDFLHIFELVYAFIFELQLYAVGFRFEFCLNLLIKFWFY